MKSYSRNVIAHVLQKKKHIIPVAMLTLFIFGLFAVLLLVQRSSDIRDQAAGIQLGIADGICRVGYVNGPQGAYIYSQVDQAYLSATKNIAIHKKSLQKTSMTAKTVLPYVNTTDIIFIDQGYFDNRTSSTTVDYTFLQQLKTAWLNGTNIVVVGNSGLSPTVGQSSAFRAIASTTLAHELSKSIFSEYLTYQPIKMIDAQKNVSSANVLSPVTIRAKTTGRTFMPLFDVVQTVQMYGGSTWAPASLPGMVTSKTSLVSCVASLGTFLAPFPNQVLLFFTKYPTYVGTKTCAVAIINPKTVGTIKKNGFVVLDAVAGGAVRSQNNLHTLIQSNYDCNPLNTASLTVSPTPACLAKPPQPRILVPKITTIKPSNFSIQWESIPGATGYHLYIDRELLTCQLASNPKICLPTADFVHCKNIQDGEVCMRNIDETITSYTQYFKEGTYKIWVEAVNGCGVSASQTQIFSLSVSESGCAVGSPMCVTSTPTTTPKITPILPTNKPTNTIPLPSGCPSGMPGC